MTHKEEVRLNRLRMKLELEMKIVDNLLNEAGEWNDGTGKGKVIFRAFTEDILEATVSGDSGEPITPRYYITTPGWKAKMGITDDDLDEILTEGVMKVQAAKAKAKQEADEAKQKKSKIGYMDVFKRVADFIRKNGYTISTPKDEQSPIVMKVGTNPLRWNNVKDFVSAGWHSHGCWDREGYISIFRVISYWTSKYYKLAYPSLRKLVDKVKVLGEVSEQAKVPVAVMKELNRLKI